MTTICPKCRHSRSPDATVPDWQCPHCGVAYNKAAEALNTPRLATSGYVARPEPRRIPWGALILGAVIAWGAWSGIKFGLAKYDGTESTSASAGQNPSTDELARLAGTVKPGDVVMYTTTHCPYCAQAKAWLNQYGFAFDECDAEQWPECASQMQALGANGVPFLLVRGQPMKEGFDTEQFLALLK
ncbi:hypothetical protein JHS3_05330 [Jeongeupia sp. HS-3]|uniref:glutaredoxin family protein n=1 Tax=Jeongeupia sp. HS-3 TaxID=1009682 RepID=UPI0018A57EB7|nr:glutaredoxin family protein [Jeongeupia sp. HS-3]BCL74797.1 hypothetical protein JHS3_05330 [Jeongeupia sp. HS-3]